MALSLFQPWRMDISHAGSTHQALPVETRPGEDIEWWILLDEAIWIASGNSTWLFELIIPVAIFNTCSKLLVLPSHQVMTKSWLVHIIPYRVWPMLSSTMGYPSCSQPMRSRRFASPQLRQHSIPMTCHGALFDSRSQTKMVNENPGRPQWPSILYSNFLFVMWRTRRALKMAGLAKLCPPSVWFFEVGEVSSVQSLFFFSKTRRKQLIFEHPTSFWHGDSWRFREFHPVPSWIVCWLVVWNMTFIFPYIGRSIPNWRIFFRGFQTTNQVWWTTSFYDPFWCCFACPFWKMPIPAQLPSLTGQTYPCGDGASLERPILWRIEILFLWLEKDRIYTS